MASMNYFDPNSKNLTYFVEWKFVFHRFTLVYILYTVLQISS